MMRCVIWYHLYNFKKVKQIHGGVLLLVKLQAKACNLTKIDTPSWAFLCFLDCTNETKSSKTSRIIQYSTIQFHTE